MTEKTCTCTNDCALGFNPNCSCECSECSCNDTSNIIGTKKKEVFDYLCDYINSTYEMEKKWKKLTKNWNYEYKFQRGGKTLCGFYIKKDILGFMLIFGKAEREKIESTRENYSNQFLKLYDDATTYRDGKWVMLELEDSSLIEDIKKLLLIKRRPNKK